MELIGPICDVLKCLGGPTCRYIDHHRKLGERMNDLQTTVALLNTRKRDMELRIKAELRRGKILREEVEKWLRDVQLITDEIKAIDQGVQNVSCFKRARLGKLIAQKLEQVEKVIERGRFAEALVTDKPSATGVTFPLGHLEGETIVMEEIWGYLMRDEVGMIGVCGMGGIGKTTVMKHIYNKLLNEANPPFDEVIWVTVSKELNIAKLRREIANAVKIVSLPEPEQECVAALMEELGQKRYVLILDDVWKEFSLLEVGIPKPTSSNGSKLVLTSRLIDVCKSMDCEIVKVRPLSEEESMNLFLEHVGRGVLKVPSLKEILDCIVRECDGLPLAILVMAGSMKGIYDVHEWRNALRELREHVRSVKGTDREIYERLKFSYDRLEDSNIQNCFLYCSLYPEDHIIPRMELIEHWIDEGFLGIGSRQELYDRGHTILNRLENNSLLEKDGDRNNVKMHDVMRDTALYIKDRSRFMVKAGMQLKEMPSKQEWAEDLEKVSLMKNSISEIPPDLSPNCEILSTLLLQKNRSLRMIPESFFQHMKRLGILDLSYTNIEQLPNSVSNLEKLNALLLRGCIKLRYMSSVENLKALRKLDIRDTAIEAVPKGLEMLANLTYLNLCTKGLKELPVAILSKLSCLQYLVLYVESGTLKLNGLEAAGLRKLETFEGRFNELIDFNMYSMSIQGLQRLTSYLLVMAPPEAEFNVIPLEVGCTTLAIEFQLIDYSVAFDQPFSRKLLRLLEVKAGSLSIVHEETGRLKLFGEMNPMHIARTVEKMSRKISLISGKRADDLPKKDVILSGCQIGRENPVALPSDVGCLRIFECHHLRSLSDISLFQQTNVLRLCSVHDCRGMESVLDLSSSPCTPLQNLELLWLENLDNLHLLVKVGEEPVVSGSSSLPLAGIFSHLKSFRIEGCSNMKQLFPFGLGNNLQNLETLIVGNCGQMKEIIASEEEEENHKGKGTCSSTKKFTLPKLKMLKLKKLPELKRICRSNGVMICDSLEVIKVWECPKLKRMSLYLPLFQDTQKLFSHPFKRIRIYPKNWWTSVEWDYPNAKDLLRPWLVIK